jgi:hypothetical protein
MYIIRDVTLRGCRTKLGEPEYHDISHEMRYWTLSSGGRDLYYALLHEAPRRMR